MPRRTDRQVLRHPLHHPQHDRLPPLHHALRNAPSIRSPIDTHRPELIPIDDPLDPRVSAYANQKDAWLKAQRGEDPGGLFIAEGALVVRALIDSPYPTRSVLLAPQQVARMLPWLARLPPTTPVYLAGVDVMSRIVGFHIHRGILAVGARLPTRDEHALLGRCRTVVVLEDLTNHDNVGGIFRSVAALAGPDAGVLLSPRCCDPLYRKALRVSIGHTLHVPYARASTWPDALDLLRHAGFDLLALDPRGSPLPTHPHPGRVALLVGTEGPGLSDAARTRADRTVSIPMRQGVDSLSAVVATSIALFCLRRDSP